MHKFAFEWDPKKESANARKHGIDFREATTVFGDPLSITIPDPDHSNAECRYIVTGRSDKQRMLIVVHTISARTATKQERRCYEETN